MEDNLTARVLMLQNMLGKLFAIVYSSQSYRLRPFGKGTTL